MKSSIKFHGYLRSVILSLCAAVIIEGIVNADEVKAAFIKGKELKNVAVAFETSSKDLLQIPQKVSGVLGTIYYGVFS